MRGSGSIRCGLTQISHSGLLGPAADLVVLERKICNVLKFVRLVCILLLRAQIVDTVPGLAMPLTKELLDLCHGIPIKPCTSTA
jgi:hypothetical protein